MAVTTIKQKILSALQMFWGKLKTTYVTSTASNAGDNLALAASAGYSLQQQINTLNSKYSTTVLSTSVINTGFTNTGHELSVTLSKSGNIITMSGYMKTGSALNAAQYTAMFSIPETYYSKHQIVFQAFKEGSGSTTFYMHAGTGSEWVRLQLQNGVVASTRYDFTVSYIAYN